MGYRQRQRATGKGPVTRETIDRFNKHEQKTYPEVHKVPNERASANRYRGGRQPRYDDWDD